MPSKKNRLNLRVPEELLDLLEEIRERKGMKTISDVVRDALDIYADNEVDSWNSGTVKVKIPRMTLEELEGLVILGDAIDTQQAINFAVRTWVDARKQYLLEGREALREKIGEILEERVAKEKMKTAAQEMSRR